jgi:hypothetical protein
MTHLRHPFPPAVVRCLRFGARPTTAEIDDVAARILSEIAPEAGPWRELSERSPMHRRALYLAQAALGLAPDNCAVEHSRRVRC